MLIYLIYLAFNELSDILIADITIILFDLICICILIEYKFNIPLRFVSVFKCTYQSIQYAYIIIIIANFNYQYIFTRIFVFEYITYIMISLILFLYAIITTKSFKQSFRMSRNPNINEKECSICLNSINQDCQIAELTCSHVFHYGCLMNWIRHGGHTCPLC